MPLNDVIAPFSQVGVMGGLTKSAAATAGACHNFTLHWLQLMFQDGGDTADAKATARMAELAKGKGASNAILQKVFGQQWTQEGVANADKLMCSLRGLTPAGDAIAYNWYDQALLVNKVTAASEAGMVYSFWFPGGTVGAPDGAHTIGFFRRMQAKRGLSKPADNIVSAYDPNFGECRMVEGDYNAWVDSLKAVYGGTINTQWLKYVRNAKG